jgi:hypothetical protein
MSSARNPGRVAGLWYLLVIVFGTLYLVYIPNKVFVHGNAAATVSNLVSHEWLFRLGMVDELLCAVLLVLLVLSLQRLFQGVDRQLAVLVVILGGVLQAAISLVNVANNAGALRLATDPGFLPAFEGPQRTALAMLLLKLHDYGINASLLLSGAWLFPLGTLVYRSRFVPRFLGVWLLLGGIGWLILFLTAMLAPQYQGKVFAYAQPVFFGEIALTLWLLIRGARPPALDVASSSPSPT